MKQTVTVMILLAAAVGVIGSNAWAVEPAAELTKSQVKALIQTAKTPADHMKLAAYYRHEANGLQIEMKNHEEMAAAYDKNPSSHPIPKWPTLGVHCRNLVKSYGESINEANQMAVLHEEMAKAAK
jgi:hypothetical protein